LNFCTKFGKLFFDQFTADLGTPHAFHPRILRCKAPIAMNLILELVINMGKKMLNQSNLFMSRYVKYSLQIEDLVYSIPISRSEAHKHTVPIS
jgi:hypothetical protein